METPLILQNIRIHGLGEVVDAPWVNVDKAITFFSLPSDFNSGGFLHTLQSINPPYSLRQSGIFQDFPPIIRQGKYQKRVRPEKRTVALAIFIAQPDLIKELGEITLHLYETDRVEVGRRLDYSRWVNFVEISSSTRWGEVGKRILQLAEECPDSMDEQLQRKLIHLRDTDRVEGGLMESLSAWLHHLKKTGSLENRHHIEKLVFDVNRQNDFIEAKAFVRRRLPYFYLLGKNDDINKLEKYILSEKRNNNPPPVLLVDEHAFELTNAEKQKWRQYAADLSQACQVLYFLEGEAGGLQPETSLKVLPTI